MGGHALARRKVAPAERSASEAGRPWASVRPSMVSPAEWATMNQTGVPEATIEPIMEPAEVPTMRVCAPWGPSRSRWRARRGRRSAMRRPEFRLLRGQVPPSYG